MQPRRHLVAHQHGHAVVVIARRAAVAIEHSDARREPPEHPRHAAEFRALRPASLVCWCANAIRGGPCGTS
jgi:hypothetical protein